MNEIVSNYFKTGNPSVYLRRWDTDTRQANPSMRNLFQPHHKELIKKNTKGKWNTVYLRSNAFRLAYEEDGKIKEVSDRTIMYTYSLNCWEHVKGGDLGPIHCIFFDEFLTRGNYIRDEFIIFANVISSIKRDRETIIYMVANSVNKYAPYWEEMGLYDIENQKKGSICIYSYNNSKLKVAVEYCADSENTKTTDYYFAFDNERLNMITNGDWEQANYPHLTESYTKDDIKFVFYVSFTGHYIKGIVYKRDDNVFIYFVPCIDGIPKEERVLIYSDKPSPNRYYSESFRLVTNKKQALIANLIKNRKVYYSSNTVGEIIMNFIKWGEAKSV